MASSPEKKIEFCFPGSGAYQVVDCGSYFEIYRLGVLVGSFEGTRDQLESICKFHYAGFKAGFSEGQASAKRTLRNFLEIDI